MLLRAVLVDGCGLIGALEGDGAVDGGRNDILVAKVQKKWKLERFPYGNFSNKLANLYINECATMLQYSWFYVNYN